MTRCGTRRYRLGRSPILLNLLTMTPFSPPCIKAWRVEPAISDVGGFAIGSDIAVQESAGSPSTPWFLLLLQVKPGWSTPRGNFSIFNKDIDHHSRSFGSVFDAYGRMVNSNATPGSHVPRGGHYQPAPMPYFMEFSPAVGMPAGYLPGYPASHGCVRMPRDLAALFFERVQIGTPVTVVGSADNVARVRRALPILPTGSYVVGKR